MKIPSFIFYGSLFGLVATLLVGCGGRGHSYTKKTSTLNTEGDPIQTEEIAYNSTFRLVGQKFDASELAVTDAVGTNGWTYGVQAVSVSAEPKSPLIEAVENIAVAVAPAALDAAMKYFTGSTSAGSSIEDSERLLRLEEGFADLETIAKAIREENKNGRVEGDD